MKFYCDGSADKRGRAGFAVVTDEKVVMGEYFSDIKHQGVSAHAEMVAFLFALRAAKEGDTIYTDQEVLVQCIESTGTFQGNANAKSNINSKHWKAANAKLKMLRAQADLIMKSKRGVTVEFLPRENCLYSKGNIGAHLADKLAGFCIGKCKMGVNLTERIGKREVHYV